MAKVLVLYYSAYGHIETMAYAVAEGARNAGATVEVKRVPETVPEAIAKASHFKLDQPAPIATPGELANYDAIIVGAPTRFGRMPSAMGSFWEQAGALWMSGALIGKAAGAFTSSATQHGGNETTLFSIIANLFHFGTGCPTVMPGRARSTRSWAGRRTARRQSPARKASASRPRSSSTAPGIRAN
jgi:NAD(P)H dehydrogenase (quinone)